MIGNIQIEVLNESAVMVAAHLKDVSELDKHIHVMSLAQALGLSPAGILVTSYLYPDFLAKAKCAKSDLSNNCSTPDL